MPEIIENQKDKFNCTRNLYPNIDKISEAIADIITDYGWSAFALIYDSPNSLVRLHQVLQRRDTDDIAVGIYYLPAGSDIRPLLKEITKSGETRIIIDCSIENTINILKLGLQIKLKDEYIVSSKIYLVYNYD